MTISEEKMEQDEIVPILSEEPPGTGLRSCAPRVHCTVQCPDCGAVGPPAPNIERAAVRWNHRKGTISADEPRSVCASLLANLVYMSDRIIPRLVASSCARFCSPWSIDLRGRLHHLAFLQVGGCRLCQ